MSVTPLGPCFNTAGLLRIWDIPPDHRGCAEIIDAGIGRELEQLSNPDARHALFTKKYNEYAVQIADAFKFAADYFPDGKPPEDVLCGILVQSFDSGVKLRWISAHAQTGTSFYRDSIDINYAGLDHIQIKIPQTFFNMLEMRKIINFRNEDPLTLGVAQAVLKTSWPICNLRKDLCATAKTLVPQRQVMPA